MKSPLIPEKPILVYPSLANTVGLDEAIMLTVLSDLTQGLASSIRNGYAWYSLETDCCREAVPFWQAHDIQRVCNSLRDKGVLLIGASAFGADANFRFAFNEKVAANEKATANEKAAAPATAARAGQPQRQLKPAVENTNHHAAPPFGKNYIAPNWQPHPDTLAQLAQHSIPSHFALAQVPEFVTYWRDRREAHRSWESKFHQHVLFKWRGYEAKQHRKDQEIAMHPQWRPSADAMDVLVDQAGISREFIEDAIPEFILYWQERGDVTKTWNSKFIQHVKIQWKKYHSALEHSTDPKPIAGDWQPSEDVYDVLRLANIDIRFARELLPEFVIYWRDSNQLHTSWNTRFLQHVKKQWARRHALNMAGGELNPDRSTREIPLEEKLTDRSWAHQ